MPRKPNVPAAVPDGVEGEFIRALNRLIEGAPEDPTNRKKARAGRLRINPTTVAREAKRARTLIAHAKCAYPNVRNAIDAYKTASEEPPTTFESINRGLRQQISKLEKDKNVALSLNVAMLRRMRAVEKETNRRIDLAKRIVGECGNPSLLDEFVGISTYEPNEKVVPIRRSKRRKRPFKE